MTILWHTSKFIRHELSQWKNKRWQNTCGLLCVYYNSNIMKIVARHLRTV